MIKRILALVFMAMLFSFNCDKGCGAAKSTSGESMEQPAGEEKPAGEQQQMDEGGENEAAPSDSESK